MAEQNSKIDDETLEKLMDSLRAQFGEGVAGSVNQMVEQQITYSYIGLIFFVLLMGLIVFFGYKLYKSLSERERRREEKRRQKQQKKKK